MEPGRDDRQGVEQSDQGGRQDCGGEAPANLTLGAPEPCDGEKSQGDVARAIESVPGLGVSLVEEHEVPQAAEAEPGVA